MYRLLIVDNERLIVDNLIDLIKKSEELDIEVFGAYSSMEALELMAAKMMDIVLSDIRMPGMNGLELQQEIKKRWPRTKVIFLSGYGDFEYIQLAMRNQSVDYLLKTEGEDKIVETVAKAIKELDKSIEMDQQINHAKRQMKLALPLIQKEFLWSLVQGDCNVLRNLGQQFGEIDLPLIQEQPVLLAVGRVDDWHNNYTPNDRNLLLYAIRNIADEYWNTRTRTVSLVFDNNKVLWFIQPTDEAATVNDQEAARVRNSLFVQEMAPSIQRSCRQLLNLNLSMVLAGKMRDWQDVPEQFDTLTLMLNCGAGLGQETILIDLQHGNSILHQGYDHDVRSGLKVLESLAAFLENGQRLQYFSGFAKLIALGSGAKSGLDHLRMEISVSLASMFLSYINRWGLHTILGERHDLSRLIRVDSLGGWSQTVDYFTALSEALFEIKQEGWTFHENDIVKHVQWYVEQNMAGDLSLTKIGDVVGHNPYYLSRLYKRITGEGLSEFITQARVRKTKELLAQHVLRISDIAKAVGFLSDQSFYRFFKKITGLTPYEYRERHDKK